MIWTIFVFISLVLIAKAIDDGYFKTYHDARGWVLGETHWYKEGRQSCQFPTGINFNDY